MERTPVQSAMIRSIGYDAETKTLEIEFSNGRVYEYAHVQPGMYRSLMGAESIGRYFSRNVKNNRQFKEVVQ
jgi:KTSC domain